MSGIVRTAREGMNAMQFNRVGGICAAALAACLCQPAFASDAAGASAAEEGSAGGIRDIVVTAQKRSTLLQKTPAAITAITGEALVEKGISDLRGVQSLVPSARFQVQNASIQIFIRGVGTSLDFGNIQPLIALNLNGVSTPREGASAGFFDVGQVEVLPGPQGTLYGGTAMGGTINIAFNRPTRELESKLTLEGGNHALVHATAVQNIPVSDTLAIRAAVDFVRHDGYQTSGADSQKDFSGRLSALYEPSDGTSVYLWGYAATKDGHPKNVLNTSFDGSTFSFRNGAFLHPGNPWNDTLTGPLAIFAPFGPITALDQSYDNYGLGAQIDVRLGNATLTSISSYLDIDSDQSYFLTSLPARITQKYKQLTQEFRLAGDAGALRWLVGLYGSHLKNGGDFKLLGGAVTVSDVRKNRLNSAAVFGELTYSLSEALRLTGGARLSFYDRVGNGVAYNGVPYDFDENYKHVDYKVGLDYDLAPNILGYIGYQTGYSPGTFNESPNTPTFSNEVKPSNLSAISAGVKSRLFDSAVQLNGEVYYYSYKKLLIQSYDINAAFNPIFNPQKTEIYGAQVDLVVKPTRLDQLQLSVGYLHGTYKKFTAPNGSSYDGNSIAFAPDWTINAGYFHDFELSSGYIRLNGDARYESSYWGDYAHTAGHLRGNFWLFDAALTYHSGNDRWSLGAWIKNIGNKAVIEATGLGGIPGPTAGFVGAPRTFGGRVALNF